MSTFAVKVVRIRAIEPIPNADAIELAVVGAYRSVVRKDADFRVNEMVLYIPEQSLVPEWLLKKLGLEGKLAGPEKNRVKAVKLRGCLSQGICVPVRQLKATTCSIETEHDTIVVKEGENIADLLGIKKWEPTVPQHFAGELYAAHDLTTHYDIENFKWFPDVIAKGEEVVITEKLHGSFCGVGIVPTERANPKHWLNRCVVFSKGLGSQGLCLLNTENNAGNAYIRALKRLEVFEKLVAHVEKWEIELPLFLLGELYGPGIQDALFTYGQREAHFRVFDVMIGYRGDQTFQGYDVARMVARSIGVDTVPELYRGPFDVDILNGLTNGPTSSLAEHIREGVVVKPVVERQHPELGRVILKSVSEAYLLRKGNTTEYN